MRRLAALALVACSGSPRATEPVRPIATVPADAATPSAERSPIPTVHATRDIREAPHAGAILTLALSPDATLALSTDELGGVRLWPALDGSQEPRIVDMPHAKQLAVGRLADAIAAVALDESGGLYVAKLDASGRQLSHTTLPGEPAVLGIAMTSIGLLAWRADQTLVLLDADGATKAKLATEPQQRVVAVAVNGTHAIAVLQRDGGKRQARKLRLAPNLAWGEWVARDLPAGTTFDIALSPTGDRLAVLARTDRTATISVLALASGKQIATSPFNTTNAEVGFADEDTVALGGFAGLSWIDLTVAEPKPSSLVASSPGTRTRAALATGGGRAITAMNGDLVLSTPTSTEFLGYDTVAPRIAEVGPNGQLLVGVGDHMVLLGQDLRANAATPPFTGITGQVAELRWLGEDDWLLESSSPTDASMQIALVNAKLGTSVVRKGIKEAQIVHYEPSTQQVTLSFGAESEVTHFDRKLRRLDPIASVRKSSPYEQVLFLPTSPALARGVQLVQITMRDKSTIKWLRDPRALDKPSTTATVDGPFAGADAAGNVYMWRNTPAGLLELAVYADGKLVRTLPNSGAIALWPEPGGTRYVEIAQSTVAMYDSAGTQLWLQQLATSQEALWLTDGSLALTSAGGIARLDPATGAVTAARCGWRFGLARKPHPATPRVEPLCSQMRR
jgi:hypothetical protein